ncbi:hypothetical protein L2E82_11815 [Cichorium intybus]|uniref:Uncharacterized protein n=1 Tax=Cichorium intybus TaxID=13427 RepID=A0ACB9GF01_CICIN|nr:hypothetical protein L2E82_11815 [Cichorium intybus]
MSHNPAGDEWKTVYRRNTNRNNIKDDRTTIFVGNIPDGVSKQDLRVLFERYGRIVDIYQATKKDRNGSNFAFIRFAGVKDGMLLEKSIGRVSIGHSILVVNIARFQRKPMVTGAQPNQPHPPFPPPPFTSSRSLKGAPSHPPLSSSRSLRGVKSFAQVVAGSHITETVREKKLKEIALSPSDEFRNFLNDTVLVGEVTNMMIINSLPDLFNDCGISFDKVFYYGGLHVIISFDNAKDAGNFLSDKESWSRWFYWVKAGREITNTPSQRIANIKIVGLPLEFRSISL